MHGVKGQITVFIIFGVLILVGVFTFFILSESDATNIFQERTSFENLELNARRVRAYVHGCLIDVALPGIFLLGKQGGYLYYYEDAINTERGSIAYHFKHGFNQSISKMSMEFELSRYIRETVIGCINRMDYIRDYGRNTDTLNVNVEINKNNIEIKLNYPFEIFNENDVIRFDTFREIFPIRLGNMISKKNEILNTIEYNQDTLRLKDLTAHDMEINIFNYDANTRIYGIYDLESSFEGTPFILNFATKIFLNSAPTLHFVPSKTLKVGYLFNYQLTGEDSDNDNLYFYSENEIVNVEPNGLITFLPITTGTYKDTICISDRNGGKNCQKVTYWVEE